MTTATGTLSERIRIEVPVTTTDKYGQEKTRWEELGNGYWAKVHQSGSREVWRAQQQHPDVSHVVEMRYMPKLTEDHRIKWEGRTLYVMGPPRDDERKLWTIFECGEEP